MDPSTAPGVTAPPAEVTAPDQSTGREAVINADGSQEQAIPFARFKEVNDRAKAESDRATQLERELEEIRNQPSGSTTSANDDIEPETLDLIKKSAEKLGFVSKQELDAREARLQVQQDINALSVQYKDSGIPFDGQKVIAYAKANGMPLGSKRSLDAVYKEMNYESIVESQRKAAVDAYIQGGKNGAEKPGGRGAQAPEPKAPGSIKDRIKAAREKAGFSIS